MLHGHTAAPNGASSTNLRLKVPAEPLAACEEQGRLMTRAAVNQINPRRLTVVLLSPQAWPSTYARWEMILDLVQKASRLLQ